MKQNSVQLIGYVGKDPTVKLLDNGSEYSVSLSAEYYLKSKVRKSWINIINPFRSLLALGSPGSGKSYFVIRHVS